MSEAQNLCEQCSDQTCLRRRTAYMPAKPESISQAPAGSGIGAGLGSGVDASATVVWNQRSALRPQLKSNALGSAKEPQRLVPREYGAANPVPMVYEPLELSGVFIPTMKDSSCPSVTAIFAELTSIVKVWKDDEIAESAIVVENNKSAGAVDGILDGARLRTSKNNPRELFRNSRAKKLMELSTPETPTVKL